MHIPQKKRVSLLEFIKFYHPPVLGQILKALSNIQDASIHIEFVLKWDVWTSLIRRLTVLLSLLPSLKSPSDDKFKWPSSMRREINYKMIFSWVHKYNSVQNNSCNSYLFLCQQQWFPTKRNIFFSSKSFIFQ